MRLPQFITKIPVIGKVLEVIFAFISMLAEEVARRIRQLSVQTADTALSLWERDYSLPSDGSDEARRARIHATRTGSQTLTVERLKELALTVGGADDSVVTEKFDRYQVILSALFDGETPEDLFALEEAVARRRPAHLDVRVQTTLPDRKIVYYGAVTPLSVARADIGAVSIGDHALFVNGSGADAYNAQLVRTNPEAPFSSKTTGAAATAGEYAVVTGGYQNTATTVYDTALTRSLLSALTVTRYNFASVSTKRHALFCGGQTSSGYSAVVDAVDENLAVSAPTAFGVARGYYGAASNNGYAVFAGGYGGTNCTAVDVYGPELEKLAVAQLANSPSVPGAASAGAYILIAGGRTGQSAFTSVVTAYSADFTRLNAENLSAARQLLFDVTFEDQAVFAGGGTLASTRFSAVDCYNAELTHTTLPELSTARESYGGASRRGAVVGDFALIAGGYNGNSYFDTVDAYTVE